MAFYASNFVYDGTISSEYGLHISTLSDSGGAGTGGNVKLFTQEIYRRPKMYLFGVQQTPVLVLPVTITVPTELSATESSVISRWLFGQMGYKKLQILQPDMMYVYFNCIFTEPQVIRYGNIIRGYNANITCDSPFAWEYPKTESREYGIENYIVDDTFVINNISDNPDYTYPTVGFRMNRFGGNLTITNATDNNRVFEFTGLSANERITVDNDLQTVTSSVRGANRLPNFTNYNWLRYVPNINNLIIQGNIRSIGFRNVFAKKMS